MLNLDQMFLLLPNLKYRANTSTSSFRRCSTVERLSNKSWIVDLIDENGVVAKEQVKTKEVWSLSMGKKIVCPLNSLGQGVGGATGLNAQWLGDLATDIELIPLNFFDWRDVAEKYMKDTIELIEVHLIMTIKQLYK